VNTPHLFQTLFAGEFAQHPSAVRELAFYLVCRQAEPWGVWHLTIDTICEQTGRAKDSILKSLVTLEQLFFARYDHGTGYVFVPDLPVLRIEGWPVLPRNTHVRLAKRWYAEMPDNPFVGLWYDRHAASLYLARPPAVRRREYSATQSALFDLTSPVVVDPRLSVTEQDAWIDRILKIYPRRDKLDKAHVSLAKLRPTAELMTQIWTALQWQVRTRDWLKEGGRFAPSLYSYFADRRWLDQPGVAFANESTINALSAAVEFINDAPEEEDPCVTPVRNAHALPRPSKRLRS
jgi:hypothetical protein